MLTLADNIKKIEAELESLKDSEAIVNKSFELFLLYMRNLDFLKAKKLLAKALSVAKKTKNLSYVAGCHQRLGETYFNLYQIENCLTHFFKALKIRTELDDSLQMATTLNSIAIVYDTLEDYPKALDYFKKALILREYDDDLREKARSYNYIGHCYQQMKQYNRSVSYLTKSYQLFFENEDYLGSAFALIDLAEAFYRIGQDEKSYKLFMEASKIGVKFNNKSVKQRASIGIAKNLSNQGNLKSAEDLLESTLSDAIKEHQKEIVSYIYLTLSEIYANSNQYKKAYHYHKRYIDQKKEIFDEKHKNHMEHLQLQYNYDLKVKEVELAMEVTTNHEFNQPLMIIRGNLELMQMKLEDKPRYDKYFNNVFSALDRINSIFVNLRKLRKIDFIQYHGDIQMIDIDLDCAEKETDKSNLTMK